MIDYSVDGEGIATIAWNMTERPMNVMNDESIVAFGAAVDKARADAAVKGVIVTSKKADFVAGADLTSVLNVTGPEDMSRRIMRLQMLFRGIEKAGKPFVAAMNGTALGGGYEICLACHRRIAADNPKAVIGLPEVSIGLLPGAGGTQRLPRLIGIRAALPLLLEGRKLNPRKALEAGMVDEVVAPDELLARAKAWLLAAKPEDAVKPWDKKGFKIPGGAVQSPMGAETFTAGNAMLREKTMGNYLAPQHIMSCVFEGAQVDMDNAIKVETRYFTNVALSKQAANMIRTLFFSMGEANKLASRPKDVPVRKYTKVGILGAGMMGAGIAYVTAQAGIDVVLLDTSRDAAEKGKAYSTALLDKQVGQKRITAEQRDAVLARIKATTDFADLAGCQMVIEAVFEDRTIKADVTKKAEAVIGKDAVFASNTSTLPITGLAEASARPKSFIGLHFFSPVDKMPLVEIIMGKKTSQEALARAMDYVKAIRKTPIVVNDSRGFYTSRVFGTYVNEGLALLEEGALPALVDNAGRIAGMPVGPLALSDEVAIDLIHKVGKQTKADLGAKYQEMASHRIAALMVEKLGRVGKKGGKGFYDYPADGKKRLWPGLKDHFKPAEQQPKVDEAIKRMMYIQAIETVRCMEEKVVTRPQDADVGAILGWGFPPFHGGPISYIHSIGVPEFVAEAKKLAKKHGPRFKPPKLLEKMAAEGKAFYAQ